jgi:hypothetical protein
MASRSLPPSKRGRREDDDDESRCWKKLEKGKEPMTKDADEEQFFDDTKFAVELLRSAFRKLEDVGVAFDIKAHDDVYKDPRVKGLVFRFHGLAEMRTMCGSRTGGWSLLRTMCGSRTGGWSLPCVMSDCQRCVD